MLSRTTTADLRSYETSGFLVSAAYQPALEWFFHVFVSNNDNTADPNAQVTVELTYDVSLFQPHLPSVTLHDTTGAEPNADQDPDPPCEAEALVMNSRLRALNSERLARGCPPAPTSCGADEEDDLPAQLDSSGTNCSDAVEEVKE
jgi:hypothetical protein